MNITNIFPTPLAVIDDVICSDDTKKALNKLRIVPQPIDWTGTSYSENRYLFHEKEFEQLSADIMNHVVEFAKAADFKFANYQYAECWVTSTSQNRSQHAHTHSNSLITGVYYFDDWIEAPPIILQRHYENHFKYTFGSTLEDDVFIIPQKQHRLLLFPTYQLHYVLTNIDPRVRKSLAFNVLPKGKFGALFGEIDYAKLSGVQ